jgi:site-specific recombinase XerD
MPEKSQNEDDWRELLENEAKLRGYSQRTITNYSFHVDRFLKSGKSLREYLLFLINSNYKDETVRGAGFAIKFYFKIKGLDTDFSIPNVKREKKLPTILSKNEIEKMILSTHNLKHRAVILIGYGAGLRVSEIMNLKWEDIDFHRNMIHIRRAKGKKDRVVMLSPKIKKVLNALGSSKTGSVFESNRGGKYGLRGIEKIVKNAATKAGIKKNVSPHTLRHTFATHLLERGTDIRYIKDLLGHSNVSTTLVYTKVSNKDISRIKSPLD